jgi:hypothetical protein
MSVPPKKAKRSPRSVRVHAPAREPWHLGWPINGLAAALVMIGVLAAAALNAARPPTPETDTATADVRPETVVSTPRPDTKATVASRQPAPAAAGTRPAGATVANQPTVKPAKTPPVALAGTVTPVASKAPAPATSPSVTIAGCLDLEDDTFWLKDTSGEHAPRSRSWKSGFLMKRSPRIELVDAAHALKLGSYVGQRVAITGMLEDRTMSARSLQRVAASCN